MIGPTSPYSGYAKTVDTLNRLAGLNKELIKDWLKMIPICNKKEEKVSDDFVEKVASLVIASPLVMAKAILTEYYNVCVVVGKNPEHSVLFRKRMIMQAIPGLIHQLQEKAGDLSLRASSAKHREDKIEDPEWGF